jgi:hypothetical protein
VEEESRPQQGEESEADEPAVRVDTVDSTGKPRAYEWFAPGRGRVQQVSDGCTVQLTSVTREKK